MVVMREAVTLYTYRIRLMAVFFRSNFLLLISEKCVTPLKAA